MVRDKRLVQAAVIGDADSETPAVMPTDAIEAEEFCRQHAADTFWCGLWLGGCGQQLNTKIYHDRVCHFAHLPDPAHRSTCRRSSTGVSSADHLYIKHGLLAWMDGQGIPAQAVISRDADGARIGGEVLFTPHEHHTVQVLLDPAAARREDDGSQVLLGPGVAHDPQQLARHGYLHRIKCVPDGSSRRIQIGTQGHDGTTWYGLEECELTAWGLSTPAVEEVRRLRSTRRPIGIPPARKTAPTPAPSTDAAPTRQAVEVPVAENRAEVFADLQAAVDRGRSITDLRHRLARAEAVTNNSATAQENAVMRAAGDALLRLERGVGAPTPRITPARRHDLEQVQQLLATLRREGKRAAPGRVASLVRQLQASADAVTAWLAPEQLAEIAGWRQRASRLPVAATRPTRAKTVPTRPAPPALSRRSTPAGYNEAEVAQAVREVLERTARRGATITWRELCARAEGFAGLPQDLQRRVLLATRRAPGGTNLPRSAPLTALITTDRGTRHPYYRYLATQAGRPFPDTAAAADSAWAAAVATVHAHYQP